MNFFAAFIISLLSAVGYSIISIFIGRVAKKGAYWTSFWIQVLGLPLTLLFVPFFGVHLALNRYLFPLFIYGVGIFFAFILYSKVLSIGPVSVVQAILRLSSLITFILAVIFLGDTINIAKVVGAIFLIAGAILVSLDIKELLRKRVQTVTKALPLALLQATISGVVFVFLGAAIKHFDGFSANVGVRLIIFPLFLLSSFGRPKPPSGFFRTSWKILLFVTVGDVISFILYTYAIQLYEVSLASLMQSTFPMITAILGALFFQERLTRVQKIGILVTVLGSMCMVISG